MKQKDIRGFQAIYHRNGVCGQGFHVCSFLYQGEKLIAVVFPEQGCCAIMSSNPHERWRGDNFEDVIREAIKIQEENQPDLAYAR